MRGRIPFGVEIAILEGDNSFEFHEDVADDVGVGVLLNRDSSGGVRDINHDHSIPQPGFANRATDRVRDLDQLAPFTRGYFELVGHGGYYIRSGFEIKERLFCPQTLADGE